MKLHRLYTIGVAASLYQTVCLRVMGRHLWVYSAIIQTLKRIELEKVAIANALQLEAARATPAPSRFNYDV